MGGETLATALEREHRAIDGGIETFTAGLADGKKDTEPLVQAMDGLRRHIYLEEEFLFPPLRGAGLMIQIFAMLREHGDIWVTLDVLEASLAEDAAGPAVRTAYNSLLAQLKSHNAKEEPIIYPQADGALSPEAIAQLRESLGSGRMPQGWVCAKALP